MADNGLLDWYQSLFGSYVLKNLLNEPTRVSGISKKYIDHWFARFNPAKNKMLNYCSENLDIGVTDHNMVLLKIWSVLCNATEVFKIKCEKCKNFLNQMDWWMVH